MHLVLNGIFFGKVLRHLLDKIGTILSDFPFFHFYILFFEVKGKYFMANGRMFMFASKYMRKGKQNAKRQKTVSSASEPA